MRMRLRSLAAVSVAAGLMGGCGQGTGGDAVDSGGPEPRPAATAEAPAPSGGPLTAADVAAIESCVQLHDAVLARIDRESAAAGSLSDSGRGGDSVEGLGLPDLAARVHPPHPYGGLGGEAVVERYEQLGCEPDDEFPAILAWFGLPADTPRDLEAGPLAEAVRDRVDHDETEGAGGLAALGLARRLAEGAETGDSPLFVALRDVANAQEAYQADHGRYADSLQALVAYGVDDALTDYGETDVMIAVTAADEDAYCIHGAHHGSAVLESHDGIPHNRLPGSPSCPHTFPDIDG